MATILRQSNILFIDFWLLSSQFTRFSEVWRNRAIQDGGYKMVAFLGQFLDVHCV